MNKHSNDMKQTMHNRFFATILLAMALSTGTISAQTFSHNIGILRTSLVTINGHQMQDVHEYRQVVYAAPGQQITLQRPDYQTYFKYTRWFDYQTDAAAANLNVPAGGATTAAGAFYFDNNGQLNATYTMPSDGKVHYIACDQSVYTNYTNSTSLFKEPTLSQRLVFEIRPAAEMAARVDAATGTNWLEVHDMIAPTGNQLYIGPDYGFTPDNKYPNYFYNASNPQQIIDYNSSGSSSWENSWEDNQETKRNSNKIYYRVYKRYTEGNGKNQKTHNVGETSNTEPTSNQDKWEKIIVYSIDSTYNTYHQSETNSVAGWVWSINGIPQNTPEIVNGQFVAASGNNAGITTYNLQYSTNGERHFVKTQTTYTTSGEYTVYQRFQNYYVYSYWKDNSSTYTRKNQSASTTKVVDRQDETNNGKTYNIAKFNVTYMNINEIGPKNNLAENKRLDGAVKVTEQRFNFEGGRTTTQEGAVYYCTPLPSAESSYGFTAPGTSNSRPGGAQLKPYWGEYALMHTTDGVNWGKAASLTNHTLTGDTGNDGYLLYVDGSATPGELVNLRFNADLCPGSKMYFSAFVANIGGSTSPNLDFILTGVDNSGIAHVLTTYTSGEFGNVGQWLRILFPFEFGNDIDYTYYTLKITNKGKNASGNDFVIDDIQIFTQKPPVVPVQASTHGCANEDGTMVTAAYLRVDYQSIEDAAGQYLYQWRDHNNVPLTGLNYLNHQSGAQGEYGHVDIKSDAQITAADTCSSLLRFDQLYSQTTVPVAKYIKETVYGESRYVLYIAQPVTLTANYLYTGYLATSVGDLGSREGCGTYADLLIAGGVTINLNGEAISNGEPEVVCGGNRNEIEIVYKFVAQNTQTGELSNKVLDCKADWLYGDAAYINAHTDVYGANYAAIAAAIEAFRDGRASSEQRFLVNNLSQIGLLTLDSKGIDIELIGSNKSVSYTAFPIAGSAEGYTICTSPSTITLVLPDQLNAVIIGTGSDHDQLPEYVLLNPRRIRVGETTKNTGSLTFDIYLQSTDAGLGYTCSKATLTASTYTGSATLPATIGITPLTNGTATTTINRQTNAIRISGIENLPAGYDYTFKLEKTIATGTITDECSESDTYFKLRVVPAEVTWHPTTGNLAWNNDANWSSFAPLAETNVILQAGDYILPEPEPVSGNIQSSTYTEFEDGAQQYITYDINYQPSTCHNIYLPAGSALVGQERIDITGQAFVDIEAIPGKWAMTAFPIKGVISGDIYIPATESTKPFEVKAIDQTVGSDALDRTTYPFYHSLYNTSVKAAGGTSDIQSTTWSLASNNNFLPYNPGYVVSLGLDCSTAGQKIRLPKPESITSYRYYQYGAWVTTYEAAVTRDADYGKPAYEYNESLGGMKFTLTGNTASDIYTFGNPTFAYLDMDKVVEENSANLEGTYYVSANSSNRSTYTTHIAGKSSAQGVKNIIAPCTGVLVKANAVGTSTSLLITPEMMCSSEGKHEPKVKLSAPRRAMAEEDPRAIYITATARNFTSYAAIFSEEGASNSALSGEDAQVMLLDKAKTPFAIYSVADSLALSINQIDAEDTTALIIPLGFYAQRAIAEETLTFAGDDAFLQEWDLIDAVNNLTWSLSDGFEVLVSMPQNGGAQFYLQHTRAKAPAAGNTATGISDATAIHGEYAIYDATGRMISGKADINALRSSLPQGVYILRNGEETIKVVMGK